MSPPLPTGVRAGYGLGSVATGTFGTVPGLMLLPYLTDTSGIAAVLAGFIVFLPKAWDVVLNPIAGRISDRSTDPRGPRRPFLLKAGLLLAFFFALLFAAPDLGSTAVDALWVLVMFVACATAYAFFQVPYVAMPAEITDSYDERTRLMTWRVAILALAIMLSGASAPAIRDAFEGRAGYRVMGVAIAVLLVVGVVGAYVGTRHAPIGRVAPGAGTLREQLRIVAGARDFRLLLTTFVMQALATGAMLAGVAYVSRWVLVDKGAATILFVCFVGPALLLTPAWSALGQRIGKKKGYVASSVVLAVAAAAPGLGELGPDVVGVRRDGAGRARVRRRPGLPDGDAPRRGGGRRPSYGREPGRRLHRRLDRRRDPRPGTRAGRLRAGAGARQLPLLHRRRRLHRRGLPARLRAHRDRAGLLVAAGRADRGQPVLPVALLARCGRGFDKLNHRRHRRGAPA